MEKHSVIIYSTPSCHFCHLAKEFFEENTIEYSDYNVAEDLEKRKEMVERTQQMGVPVIVIDGKTIIGFDKPSIKQLLGL
ncbi:MAG: glutaredoxin domain-containing protein [Candidatus Harrisonbacteria bacterium]|nr:glutaredoxin domain-containing protein [Candidatus Harrisonbacteria bacterium]